MRSAHDMRLGPQGNGILPPRARLLQTSKVDPGWRIFGRYEELEEEWFPTAISIDKIGQLWAADYLFNRIRVFDVESGKHLDDIELSDKPLAIEVGRDNHVYVGFEDSITIFDKNSILIDTAPLEKTSPVFAFGR